MMDLMQLATAAAMAQRTPAGSGLPGYPQSEILTQAHQLWLAARGSAEMPARRQFTAALLEPLAAQLMVFGIEQEPLDFRYLEIGNRMRGLSNDDYTGKCLSEIPHQRAPSRVWDHLTAAMDARAPVRGVLPYVGRSREFSSIFHIVLPLADDGETVDRLLVCVDLAPGAGAGVRLQDGTHPFTQLG
ncbi:MAG: hypothetical protein KG075_03135 [Alphaproteobacteria bacterium]|nr:hypothetical protein [Alphaproteobacteria bacterium]